MGDNKTEEQVSLKLLVNKETNEVLFAEAGKDFVDVLLSFLTLPLGTVARLAQKDSKLGPVTIGCMNSLYQSVADLDKKCLWTEECKGLLLQPKNSSKHYCNTIKLNIDDTQPAEYFVCTNLETCNYGYLSNSINRVCGCGVSMNRSISLEPLYEGFVNDDATFVVTDNLNVIPTASYYTSLALVHNSGIKNMSSLKEMTVNVTKEKVFLRVFSHY